MLWGQEDKMSNGVTIDSTVPPCPVCHISPIVVERTFDIKTMLNEQENGNRKRGFKKRKPIVLAKPKEKYCYYHCQCGHCTTDWYGEIEDCDGRRILPPRERARTAYVCGNWVGSVDEFAKHGIRNVQLKKVVDRIRREQDNVVMFDALYDEIIKRKEKGEIK